MPDRFDLRQDKSTWLEMSRQLRLLGVDLTILAARARPDANDYEGLVTYVPSLDVPFLFRWITLLSSLRYLVDTLRQGDTVLLNEDALWLLPILRRIPDVHVHLDIRTIPVVLPGLKRWLDRLLFWRVPIRLFARKTASYSFITEDLRQEFERQFGRGFEPYCVWQSGVNTELFRPADPEKIETGNDEFQLFYHGGLLKTRGIDLVLRAIHVTRFPFRLCFRIVGDGPDRAALEALSKSLGLENVVKFEGYVPYEQVPALIRTADCCICPLPDLPEWRVSSPLKVFEYLACEKPLVLTPLLAHRQAAGTLATVTWSEDYSPEAIGQAIINAWQTHPSPAASLHSARQYVVDRFDWRVHAHTLFRLLQGQRSTRDNPQAESANA